MSHSTVLKHQIFWVPFGGVPATGHHRLSISESFPEELKDEVIKHIILPMLK